MQKELHSTPLVDMPPLQVHEAALNAADQAWLHTLGNSPLGIGAQNPANKFDAVNGAGFGARAPELRTGSVSYNHDMLDVGGLENALAVEQGNKDAELQMKMKAAAHMAITGFLIQQEMLANLSSQLAASAEEDDDETEAEAEGFAHRTKKVSAKKSSLIKAA